MGSASTSVQDASRFRLKIESGDFIMRMWMVDPRILCRQHLLGEHNEIHKHRHVFEKQYSIAGRYSQIEPKSMKARHDKLAAEMLRRGFCHRSPYEQPDLSHLSERDRDGTVDPEESLKLLLLRCGACGLGHMFIVECSDLLEEEDDA